MSTSLARPTRHAWIVGKFRGLEKSWNVGAYAGKGVAQFADLRFDFVRINQDQTSKEA